MAVTPTPIFPQAIIDATFNIVNGTGTTVSTLRAAGTNGDKIESFIMTSTDTAAHDIQIFKTISATNYLIGTINVPIGAGNTSGVPAVNVLASLTGVAIDANGNSYLYLAPSTTLSVGAVVTITSAKTLTCTVSGGTY